MTDPWLIRIPKALVLIALNYFQVVKTQTFQQPLVEQSLEDLWSVHKGFVDYHPQPVPKWNHPSLKKWEYSSFMEDEWKQEFHYITMKLPKGYRKIVAEN